MIVKEREVPLKILKLEALLRRLSLNHPSLPRIKEDLAKSYAGYRGEQSLDYYFELLPEQNYFILHDVRLSFKNDLYFQIDTLILTPYFFLILEVKNISGTLHFDQTFHQLIRTTSEVEEAFPDPILQVQRQTSQFTTWLLKTKFPPIPVFSFVVVSNSSSIIKSAPANKVIRPGMLADKIKNLHTSYPNEIMSLKDLRKLSRLLLKTHTPLNQDVLQLYNIHRSDVMPGIFCNDCKTLSMRRNKGSWICSQCGNNSKQAHIQALTDYSLLIEPTITNQQLRHFLGLSSISTATKLLVALKLEYTGSRKNRTYKLNF